MGCSVRFASNPIRTNERRIERLTGQRCAARGESQRKTRRVESAGSKSAFSGVSWIHHIAASHRTASLVLGSLIPTELQVGTPEGRVRAMLSAKQGEKHMPVGLFRSEGAWPVHGAPPLAARAGLASLRRDSL
jgi:hypothetical protein